MLTVQEVYDIIDGFAPFASQESWDNSGLLVGSMTHPAERILTTLDISEEVITQAVEQQVQLIVAHHPVIFSPLKALPQNHPVYQLAAHGIAAICVHTPLDIAPEGLNAYAHALLKEPLSLANQQSVLEPSWTDGRGFGWIDVSTQEWTPCALAGVLEKTFGTVRYSAKAVPIRKIAYCSGSAASMLELAAARGCDALITGDIKHDRWYAAEFENMALFDCGHYGTERFAAEILADQIQKALPRVQIIRNAGRNPAEFWVGDEKA